MYSARLAFGNIINFFAVSWGLIVAFAPPSKAYVPQNLAYESIFLNIYNERQWTTNCAYLYTSVVNASDTILPSIWMTNSSLSSAIPVLMFDLNITTPDLHQQCSLFGYTSSSDDCQLLLYTRNATISAANTIVARNPSLSKLFLCNECNQGPTSGNTYNSFLVDQNENIPWFVDTLMTQVGNIAI